MAYETCLGASGNKKPIVFSLRKKSRRYFPALRDKVIIMSLDECGIYIPNLGGNTDFIRPKLSF